MANKGKRQPPTPHLWDAAAKADLDAMAGEVGRVARNIVSVDWDGDTLVAEVGTNPDWTPPEVEFGSSETDPTRGVDTATPDGARMARIAEQAITRRVLLELNRRDTLRAWIKRQIKAHKGTRELAAALVDADPAPLMPRDRQIKNMQRKVQEWEQATHKVRVRPGKDGFEERPGPKYTKPSGRNVRRVAALRGDLDGAAVAMLPTKKGLMVGVAGWWRISRDVDDRWVYSDDTDDEQVGLVRDALANDGASFGSAANREAITYVGSGGAVYLERLNGYHVEVDTNVEEEK